MINAIDLKINNWVWLTKDGFKTTKPYQLTGFDIYKLDESDCADIKGIQLTEEILLKCGFKAHKGLIITTYSISISWNKSYKTLDVCNQQGNQYIWIREQNDDLPNDRMADNIICIFNGDIHGKLYLHTLQNAILILTQKELTIEL